MAGHVSEASKRQSKVTRPVRVSLRLLTADVKLNDIIQLQQSGTDSVWCVAFPSLVYHVRSFPVQYNTLYNTILYGIVLYHTIQYNVKAFSCGIVSLLLLCEMPSSGTVTSGRLCILNAK